MPRDGRLRPARDDHAGRGAGQSLELRYDCFATCCGSWAGFKLSRYLMQFTGEARRRFGCRSDDDLEKWLVPDKTPGTYRVEVPGGGRVRSRVVPYYSTVENFCYRMYFDRKSLPIVFA